MSWHQILFLVLFFSISMPLGYSNLATCSHCSIFVDTPVEKVKPKEKRQKRIQQKLQKKIWKQEQIKAKQGLKRPVLTFLFVLAVLALSLVILGAFLIGVGILPWIIALFILLGADLSAFAILAGILFIEVPEFPDVMAFVVGLFSWTFLNIVIGLIFLIWGLVLNWIFGWMIGLILLGLAALFLVIFFIATGIAAKKDAQKQ